MQSMAQRSTVGSRRQPRSYSAPLSHSHTRRSRGDYGKMANENPIWHISRALRPEICAKLDSRFAIAHRLHVHKVAECNLRFRLLQCNISPFYECSIKLRTSQRTTAVLYWNQRSTAVLLWNQRTTLKPKDHCAGPQKPKDHCTALLARCNQQEPNLDFEYEWLQPTVLVELKSQ